MKHLNYDLCLILFSVVVGFINLFLYCYFGKMATDSFEQMAVCLYECNWQDYPIDLQKYFILMLQNMQQPLWYHAYNVAILNLETFTKVTIMNESFY